MSSKWFTHFAVIFFIAGITLGFSLIRSDKFTDNPEGSRNGSVVAHLTNGNLQTDWGSNNNQIQGSAYFIDNFDGSNDTASLKTRGYKVYYRGTGPQGPAATWFQGGLFASFNGPPTGYVAANYQVVNDINNIDNWLVLPKKTVNTGDSLFFYARSESGNPAFPDSIRVMYSAAGDSTPESSWTELGRFKTNTGVWERKGFRAPSSGSNARFAIRYNIVNSGPDGTNGNYIGIDALSIEGPTIANDMAAISVNAPSSTFSLPASTIAPKASFKNNGTAGQTNIPVTFKITGPVNYTSNKVISSLNAGLTTQVIFDSTFVPLAGTYSVAAYSSLAADGNRYNDTVKFTFTTNDPNYGNSASYYYANSTTGSNPAPSHPSFCWKDTTGSTSLVVNTVNSQPGIITGDLDDGYWKILLPGGRKVRFFDSNYDTIRIGTNGIIAFKSFIPGESNWGPPLSGIPGGNVLNAIYPLWTDFDFSDNAATATSRISYKIAGSFLVITYDRAPVFSGDPGDYVSFQVSIDVSISPASNSRILIQYADNTGTKTGQSFINSINNNTFQRHLVGLQNISGISAFTYRFRNASAVVVPGKIFDTPQNSLALQAGPDASALNSSCFNLNLTNRLQLIQLTRKDTLTVSVRQAVSPYAIVETKKVVFDSVSGVTNVPLNLVSNGTSYYIQVLHRNSVSTWSNAPVLCSSGSMTFDFTTGVSQAYGNNQIVISTKASFYTGDINGDKCVNLTDIVAIYNDAAAFVTGSYLIRDLNYDGIVNLADVVGAYNNSTSFICEKTPPGALMDHEPVTDNMLYQKDDLPVLTMTKKEWIEKFGR